MCDFLRATTEPRAYPVASGVDEVVKTNCGGKSDIRKRRSKRMRLTVPYMNTVGLTPLFRKTQEGEIS